MEIGDEPIIELGLSLFQDIDGLHVLRVCTHNSQNVLALEVGITLAVPGEIGARAEDFPVDMDLVSDLAFLLCTK